MSEQSRHEQLIAAGWRYDKATDHYTAPGSATDGTARQYNLAAAWAFAQGQQALKQAKDAPRVRTRDPRQQEPE